MKLVNFAKKNGISTETIRHFIVDFDLDLDEVICTNFEMKPEFLKFASENKDFLLRYQNDLQTQKTVDEIAQKINAPKTKIQKAMKENQAHIFDNGFYKSSISSFGIDKSLGGDYQFVYDYFGKKTKLQQRDFIGYRDLFFYISDVLEPFINQEEAKNWGIQKPAGIILYGAPGTGKIFWAKKISEIIEFDLKEIKQYRLSAEDHGQSLDVFLQSAMQRKKEVLFIENFNDLLQIKNAEYGIRNLQLQEVIVHNISKFTENDVLMVVSADTLAGLDEEILAPGRFDVLIPVFPPNAKERAELLRYAMTRNLTKSSLLYKILEQNEADHLPFWNATAAKMKVFSNTMVLDFTQSLKKRIRNLYHKTKNEKLTIDQKLLDGAFKDASAKLIPEYLNQIQQFIYDVKRHNEDDFSSRLTHLQKELDFYKTVEQPRREIGFQHSEIVEKTPENSAKS